MKNKRKRLDQPDPAKNASIIASSSPEKLIPRLANKRKQEKLPTIEGQIGINILK